MTVSRISTEDAYAMGLGSETDDEEAAPSGTFELERVREQLKTVFDPEIPINVVDLRVDLRV